jgi:hypothetical protein
MNNLVNFKNLKNNEIGIYAIMIVIILLIIFLPTNSLISDITKNTGSLIVAFVCVCLFMLLDNRLAVLFLVLLIVSYYKNMKNDLAEKFQSASAGVTSNTEDPIIFGISKSEQEKNQQKSKIKSELTKTIQDFEKSIPIINNDLYKNINDSDELCNTIKTIKENATTIQENFLRDRVPENIRENFVKGSVPFNNQERARNFKESDLVKNLNGLATQNDRSGYDVVGCRMVTSNDDSITATYDTLNGPPLATTDYNTLQKEFIGTPFYPLNN